MENLIKNAVLVGIQLPKITNEEHEASLQELSRLVKTLGYQVVGQVNQKRTSDRAASVLGEGKLKELALWTGGQGVITSIVERKLSKAKEKWQQSVEEKSDWEQGEDLISDEIEEETSGNPNENAAAVQIGDKILKNSAQIVIVDTELSPSQIRNLESAAGVPVLDRTGVIIEIFSRHARTKAARLQVEIARLTYVAPRLRETGGNEDRGGGGVGGKGSGESTIELDRRKIRDRIKELKNELASIGNEHLVRRARRGNEISVALVGYTNAGKSSLMRAMTGSEVLVADKLFATLDTTIRPIYPETRPKVLLSDTVGFIKKLPHDLVASFKSTLDEALNASLLIFVVDASDPSFRSQLNVTKEVLKEVGTEGTPSLLILNKRDQLTEESVAALCVEFPDAVLLSTRNKEDLKMLRDRIMAFFETNMIDEDIFVPYTTRGIIGEIRGKMKVLQERFDECGVTLRVRGSPEAIERIKKMIEKIEEK